MSIVREEHFVCTDIERNNNKIWIVQEHDNASVTTRWGRVGDTLQEKTWTFSSQSAASAAYDKKKKDKLKVKTGRDAYTQVEVLDSKQPTTSTPVTNLSKVATRDIQTDNETTKELIKWLSEVNIHQILKQTTMTYNSSEGLFRTPLGVIGQSCIDEARALLTEISPYVARQAFDDADLKKCVNHYLRLIPRDLGRARDKLQLSRIFPDAASVQAQHGILDSLQASVDKLTTPSTGTKTKKKEPERVFNTSVASVTDSKILKEVDSLYNQTRQSIHVSHVYKPSRVFTIDITPMRDGWERVGAKMSNIWRLWHGTSYANLLSILYKGLQIPPSRGGTFGTGLYFSDQSTKSLNYAAGYWDGSFGKHQKCYMFLADVAMGNYHIPTTIGGYKPPGCDSIFGRPKKGNESGVQSLLNNEMIIQRAEQANLVYLVEFTK